LKYFFGRDSINTPSPPKAKEKTMAKNHKMSYKWSKKYPNPKKAVPVPWTKLDIDWWSVFYGMFFGEHTY